MAQGVWGKESVPRKDRVSMARRAGTDGTHEYSAVSRRRQIFANEQRGGGRGSVGQ